MILRGLLFVVVAGYHVDSEVQCSNTSDCILAFETCTANICTHKPLYPLNQLEITGLFATFLVFLGANAGGLGGGGAILPITIIFFRFDVKRTIALSNLTVFVSSLVRFLMNAKKTHPLKTDVNRPGL